MTKQEEIREGIASRIWYRASLPSVNIKWEELTSFARDCWLHLADEEMSILRSQGVVLRVDKELPQPDYAGENWYGSYGVAQEHMLKAGYTATEPLIEKDTFDFTDSLIKSCD